MANISHGNLFCSISSLIGLFSIRKILGLSKRKCKCYVVDNIDYIYKLDDTAAFKPSRLIGVKLNRLRIDPYLIDFKSMREIPTFAAKCAQCEESFDRPSLGDFSYGKVILNTIDGRHFATVNGFDEFPERVRRFMESIALDPESFWHLL
ncbi:MAG: hypothetical protein LBE21_00040, partial [Pseudomonadales bacterium]|nr:hypothetical protein [Pseudomonadales bacterium]